MVTLGQVEDLWEIYERMCKQCLFECHIYLRYLSQSSRQQDVLREYPLFVYCTFYIISMEKAYSYLHLKSPVLLICLTTQLKCLLFSVRKKDCC